MRLWSLHPRYLDTKGLVALWRETLLAQAVLNDETKGYRNHPQLERFKQHESPLDAMSIYLQAIHQEATLRGYKFDGSKIRTPANQRARLAVASGQVQYEWAHLLHKLEARSPEVFEKWAVLQAPELHPMFTQEDGPMASWERPLAHDESSRKKTPH